MPDALGTCISEETIDHIFGSVSEFARQVELNGDNFVYTGFRFGDVKVVYDELIDIHHFHLL